MHIIITKYTVDTWDCNLQWYMGGYKWTINKGNLLFEGVRQQVARSYVEDITAFNNQLAELILFNQEKIVLQCWEDIYQH